VLFPEVAKDKVAAARFRNEIFASYGVSHKNVVRAYEYIRDGELLAYTMEYVDGGDLADRLAEETRLPIKDILEILKQMSLGVQAIHDAGIVHRDLKPENILLTKDGEVKIADFGIARTGTGQRLTEHGGVVGTIDYVSPEYMLNSQVDWRSDIYAIGVLAYEMIVGELPFLGDSPYEVMTKRLQNDPISPLVKRKDCPEALAELVLAALDRDPTKRLQSGADFAKQLARIEQGLPLERPLVIVDGDLSDTYVGPSLSEASKMIRESLTGADTLVQEMRWDANLGELQESGIKANLEGTTQIIPLKAVSELERVAEIRLQKAESIDLGQDVVDEQEAEHQRSRMKAFSVGNEPRKVETANRVSLGKHLEYLLDIATIVVALLLGLGFGVLLLHSIFPDLVNSYVQAFVELSYGWLDALRQ
ncbi:MAG: serine/threonine protein kinase, partial [Bdellovibrionales bacterium]|nr:serine/threonine protein kinase [Bdellovibrionales bacterium]